MLAFSVTECTLDNMGPEWRHLSGAKLSDTMSDSRDPKLCIPREEYKKKLYKKVRITGIGVDIIVESVTAAAKWLGTNQPNVSKALKEGYRLRGHDGAMYNVGRVED